MGEGLGQQIVVDNKPGGAGNIGSDIGAKAAPDGYTLTMGNNATHATNQTLIPATPFDASKDFAAIGLTTTVTHVLVVHPDVPAKTIQEFVTWAKTGGRQALLCLDRQRLGLQPGDGAVQGSDRPSRRCTCPIAARRRRCRTCSAAR
jgi:hypothetical protein